MHPLSSSPFMNKFAILRYVSSTKVRFKCLFLLVLFAIRALHSSWACAQEVVSNNHVLLIGGVFVDVYFGARFSFVDTFRLQNKFNEYHITNIVYHFNPLLHTLVWHYMAYMYMTSVKLLTQTNASDCLNRVHKAHTCTRDAEVCWLWWLRSATKAD